VRSCSVCGTEIDKTTAYTIAGEQKPQGRRCYNCVEGASTSASEPTQEASVAEPASAPTPEPQASVQPESAPSQSQQTSTQPEPETPEDNSKITYIIAAVVIIAVIVLILR
jgi:cobalamin biosynthesis Mg chelatase CobN